MKAKSASAMLAPIGEAEGQVRLRAVLLALAVVRICAADGRTQPYFGPNSDPERFLRQLRVMAAAYALLCAGLLIARADGP